MENIEICLLLAYLHKIDVYKHTNYKMETIFGDGKKKKKRLSIPIMWSGKHATGKTGLSQTIRGSFPNQFSGFTAHAAAPALGTLAMRYFN